ncbi:hypothetical protein [Methylobacterium indicum]|nr:hypothetical protein [Methylobacterium indicum]
MMSGTVFLLADKRAETVTDDEVALAIQEMRGDVRVSLAEYAGRDQSGRPTIRVKVVDCAQGELDGTYSIGRVLHALRQTTAQHQAHLVDTRAFRARLAAVGVARDEREEAERRENLGRLRAAGISPQRLSWICNCLARGVYLEDDALRDWDWYEREIVRDRPAPMALRRYVAGFARS